MFVVKPYNRARAVDYAKKWAYLRNPLFTDYTGIGGNCTNFVSQAIYAATCTMNFTPVFGWYFLSDTERTASWTGVEYFYNFMTGNRGIGPFGSEVDPTALEVGDVIQLGREGTGYYHTLLVVGFEGETPLVAAQSDDAYNRPLDSYSFDFARYIKIEGVRIRTPDTGDCYESVYEGIAIIPDAGAETPAPAPMAPPSAAPAPAEPPPAEMPATEGEAPPEGGAVSSS